MNRHDILPLLESLGDNCELGFYLEANRIKKGALLRYAQLRADSAIAFVRSPERRYFSFERLVPFSRTMVKDTATHIAFHTKTRSSRTPDGWRFETDEEERWAIHADEKSKHDYLLERFEHRLVSGDPRIYVIKANEGIPAATAMAMDEALRTWKVPERFVLLAVSADPAVGTWRGARSPALDWHSDTVCHARVARFAPYDAASDIDVKSWNRVFDALAVAEKVSGWFDEADAATPSAA